MSDFKPIEIGTELECPSFGQVKVKDVFVSHTSNRAIYEVEDVLACTIFILPPSRSRAKATYLARREELEP